MVTKQKIDHMPYESVLQNLNEIEPKSIKSIFLPSHIEDILLWIVCDCVQVCTYVGGNLMV